jgi:hypothetical protein
MTRKPDTDSRQQVGQELLSWITTARPPSFLRITAYAPKSVGRALDTTPVGRVILRKPLKITVVLHYNAKRGFLTSSFLARIGPGSNCAKAIEPF